MNKLTLFFNMILHPADGWIRVGNAYPSRSAASEWLPFVRGRWHCRTKVSQCTLHFNDGHFSERSRHVLDQKYNLDPPLSPASSHQEISP